MLKCRAARRAAEKIKTSSGGSGFDNSKIVLGCRAARRAAEKINFKWIEAQALLTVRSC